ALRSYVSGIGPALAQAIVRVRDQRGGFRSRRELLEVPRLGAKGFEQAARFLRIRGGDHPLDASGVHPERYDLVEAIARDLGASAGDLVGDPVLIERIEPERYLSEHVGLPTLHDIIEELKKPGRDPRESFEAPAFRDDVTEIKDLKPGMVLEGVVTNIVAFGAFVDIGVHHDGLVHVSQLADRFVKDPNEVVHVGQKVRVTVLSVDLERNRIALSMKSRPDIGGAATGAGSNGEGKGDGRGARRKPKEPAIPKPRTLAPNGMRVRCGVEPPPGRRRSASSPGAPTRRGTALPRSGRTTARVRSTSLTLAFLVRSKPATGSCPPTGISLHSASSVRAGSRWHGRCAVAGRRQQYPSRDWRSDERAARSTHPGW